jgi:type IV pilus assembly protein PilV
VFGTGHADGNCTTAATVADRDLCEWDLDLKGATEAIGSSRVGGLTGVRGCISTTLDATATNLTGYVVQVAWQGRGSFGTVASTLTCGSGAIVPEGSRRVISVTVPVAALDQ